MPVPGGPTSSTPLGSWPPRRPNFAGVFRNSITSRELLLGLVDAGHVVEADVDVLLHVDLGLALTDGEKPVLPDLADAAEHDHPDEPQDQQRDEPSGRVLPEVALDDAGHLDAMAGEVAHQIGVVDSGLSRMRCPEPRPLSAAAVATAVLFRWPVCGSCAGRSCVACSCDARSCAACGDSCVALPGWASGLFPSASVGRLTLHVPRITARPSPTSVTRPALTAALKSL